MARSKVARKFQPDSSASIDALKRGIALHQSDQLEGAEAAYRFAVALDPRQAYALQLLGLLLTQTGRPEEGLKHIETALALAPERADIHCAHGDTLANLNRFEEALKAFDAAIRLDPKHFSSWRGRGSALIALKKVGEALEAYGRALTIKPDDPETLALSSEALGEGRFFNEAFAAVKQALAIKPDCAAAWVQCGTLLHNFGQMPDALVCLETAIAVAKPKSVPEMRARIGRGVTLARLRRFDESMEAFADALKRAPGNCEIRFQRAGVSLTRGQYAEAWDDYEARFEARPHAARLAPLPLPVWRGEPIAGKKILILDEQGNGDILQFCRLLPKLEALGAEVTMVVREGLVRLLRSLPGNVTFTTTITSIEGFSYRCPLLSVPLALGLTLATVPANIPYLRAEPERVSWWRERLGEGFKVGLVWSASIFGFREGRSAALADFAALASVPGVRLVSLQKELGVELLRAPPAGMKVETLGPEYEKGDFLETAAVVEALDLVICVDTAVAHLAGAIGRPVWVVLPYISDWRWLLDRSDSPWYPTLRVFRSRAHGDWAGTLSDVAQELRALVRPEDCASRATA